MNRPTGVLRTHLDEPSWAQVVRSAGLTTDAGLLSPLEAPRPSGQAPPALTDATRLALRGPLRIEISTAADDRGVVAALGWDGAAGAGLTRALAAVDGRPAPAPGLELSVFAPDRLVAELLRLLPPSRDPLRPPGRHTVSITPESALMAVHALRHTDTDLLDEIIEAHRWEQCPDVLAALADGVSGQAAMVLHVGGRSPVQVRSWLRTDAGWVALGIAGGHVTHELRSREQLEADLAYWIAGAVSASSGAAP